MKVVPLALNLVLVAAALLVYDTLRRPAAADYEPVPIRGRAEAAAEAPASPTLVGRGLDVAWRGGIESRLAALEGAGKGDGPARPARGAPADVAAEAGPLDLEGFLEEMDEALPADAEGTALVARFTERQRRIFRALLEDVERQREEERAARRIDRMLDRAGVQLTDGQRAEVREAMLGFQEKVRQTFEDAAGAGDPEERRTLFQGLQGELKTTLETIVPAAEADAILQQLRGRSGRGRAGGGPGGARPPR